MEREEAEREAEQHRLKLEKQREAKAAQEVAARVQAEEKDPKLKAESLKNRVRIWVSFRWTVVALVSLPLPDAL